MSRYPIVSRPKKALDIKEVRGVAENQNIEPEMEEQAKLYNLGNLLMKYFNGGFLTLEELKRVASSTDGEKIQAMEVYSESLKGSELEKFKVNRELLRSLSK